MKNFTIVVDEDELRRARIRALEEGTSVNRILAEALRRYAGGEDAAAAMDAFVATARAESYASARPRWSRDELYGDRLD